VRDWMGCRQKRDSASEGELAPHQWLCFRTYLNPFVPYRTLLERATNVLTIVVGSRVTFCHRVIQPDPQLAVGVAGRKNSQSQLRPRPTLCKGGPLSHPTRTEVSQPGLEWFAWGRMRCLLTGSLYFERCERALRSPGRTIPAETDKHVD